MNLAGIPATAYRFQGQLKFDVVGLICDLGHADLLRYI
jgi:hypothetical protein